MLRLGLLFFGILALLIPVKANANPTTMSELDVQIESLKLSLSNGISGVKSNSKAGGISWITPEVCAGQANCYGANPNSPYGVLYLPLADGEPVPPSVPIVSSLNIPNMANNWQLRDDEAVLILGWTPTSVKYFGFTPYLMGRTYKAGEDPKVIFGAFGDSLNELVIGTGGSPQVGVNSFGQFTAIILTADKNTESRIRTALAAQQITSTAINTVVVAKQFPLYTGWDSSSDLLGMLIRMGVPLDKDAKNAYINQTPLRILRVTPTTPAIVSSLATPALRPQGTGKCEGRKNLTGCNSTVDVNLENTYDSVSKEILNRFSSQGHSLEKLTPISTPYFATANSTAGALCAKLQTNCNADNRDTIYSFDVSKLKLSQSPNDFLFYIGINHVSYGKATYFNHSVYRQSTFSGVVGFSDKDQKVNDKTSIEYFLGRPAKDQTELNLYAYKISRDCLGDPFCLEVPTSGEIGVPVNEELQLMGRIYLEPATRVKPSEREVILHQLYHSSP